MSNPTVERLAGLAWIRGSGVCRQWNGIDYKLGMSGKNVGAKALSMNVAVIPPGGVAGAHIHVGFEVMLYILEGRVRHDFGEGLVHRVEHTAGDFIFIEPGVPHEVFNLSDTEPVVAVVARSSADEWDQIVAYKELEPGVGGEQEWGREPSKLEPSQPRAATRAPNYRTTEPPNYRTTEHRTTELPNPMNYVNLGRTGLKVSRLCLGMMTYGDPAWRAWVLPEEARGRSSSARSKRASTSSTRPTCIRSASPRRSSVARSATSPIAIASCSRRRSISR